MDNEQFKKEILTRLDAIIKLTTISSMRDNTQKEKIILLDSAGFGPKQIADILNTSSNTVNVSLSNLRKKKKEAVNDKSTSNDSLEGQEESISNSVVSNNQ